MQYFLDDFGNFEHFVKIWTRGPPNYYQKCFKHMGKIMESSFNILNCHLWESEMMIHLEKNVERPKHRFSFLVPPVESYFVKMRIGK